MKKSLPRLLTIVAASLSALPLIAAPTTEPTTAPSSAVAKADKGVDKAKPDTKAIQEFMIAIRPANSKLAEVEQNQETWSDANKRADLATKAQAPLKEILPMLTDMVEKGKTKEMEMIGANVFVTMAAVFGDDDLQKQVTEMAAKPGPAARWAKVAQATSKFYLANGDAEAQGKALDGLESLATSVPSAKPLIAHDEVGIYETKPSKEIADRIEKFVTEKLKNPAIAQMKEQQEAQSKQAAFVGKPMVIAGLLKDGKDFSTADLKGKVVLIDFWATWCGPCKAELPRVKKEYAEMHDKGLEVIGVSFDQTAGALDKFLAANPDMPWPQLFDPKHPFWKNELGKANFVKGIPTMFLIDKNGICRSVTAREDFEKMIPKLLAENSAT